MNIRPPDLNKEDAVFWKDFNGELVEFSTRLAWETLRSMWYSIIWFPQGIPCYSFSMWLLVKEKLKTRDKLKAWDIGTSQTLNASCALCNVQQDSHDHLFCECPFSIRVWSLVDQFITVQIASYKWREILSLLNGVANRRMARVVVTKLLLSAFVYFIWLEINARMFKSERINPDQVFNIIFSNVRLKLMSMKFKDSQQVRELKQRWNI
ncbi:uncharacterized protein [Rutidosis leptorrhynchoides]|uniref:uncharacterized protein n=1 Tax=Rutidosis leptorrhynchoides TaxID=125765 RepID=UPI003A9A5A4A